MHTLFRDSTRERCQAIPSPGAAALFQVSEDKTNQLFVGVVAVAEENAEGTIHGDGENRCVLIDERSRFAPCTSFVPRRAQARMIVRSMSLSHATCAGSGRPPGGSANH